MKKLAYPNLWKDEDVLAGIPEKLIPQHLENIKKFINKLDELRKKV